MCSGNKQKLVLKYLKLDTSKAELIVTLKPVPLSVVFFGVNNVFLWGQKSKRIN